MRIRSALAQYTLSPLDLFAAVAIALIALSLIAGPAMSQDPSPSAQPTIDAEVAIAPEATATPFASGTPGATATPLASGTPGATPAVSNSPVPAASPEPTLAPGASSTKDPCAPEPTPDPNAPTPDPNATPDPDATSPPEPNLCPAQPGANPLDLLAWIFTPIFQTIFIGLAFLYSVTGDIGISIILLTIVLRTLMIPVFRMQIVSQRRMQMLQPEIKAIQTKYKGDRAKISEQQMQLYKDRGVNPASGCLPAVLQMVLLLPMYQVFMRGLKAPDISSMLNPFGFQVVNVTCQNPSDPYAPCIDPSIPWLAWLPKIDGGFIIPGYPGGLPSNEPEIFLMVLGVFIYWITTTVFSIVQQFLINGYGGLFPLFGWTPGFAKDHQPRFPVSMPEPKPAAPAKDGEPTPTTKRSTKDSAAGTIRPARRRSRRRGRRR